MHTAVILNCLILLLGIYLTCNFFLDFSFCSHHCTLKIFFMESICLEQKQLNQGRLPRLAFNGGRSGTVKVTQLCLTLCYPVDYFQVLGILQATILEWVAFPFSRGSNPLEIPGTPLFPIQGSNPGLLHCRQILYQLSHPDVFIFSTAYFCIHLNLCIEVHCLNPVAVV